MALTTLAVSSEPLLRAIDAHPDAGSKKLAEVASRKINHIARDLDVLAGAGLIVRHPPHLTPAGREALDAIDRANAGAPLGAATEGAVAEVPLDLIDQDPTLNPREVFDEEDLQSLADSIRDKGVLQPVLLRQGLVEGRYRLVAGERRFRASKLAERPSIPAVIRQLTDAQALEIALIENIQRADLNPMEEARAFEKILAARKAEDPTVSDRDVKEVIAGVTRRSVRWVEQRLQLLQLTDKDQAKVLKGEMGVDAARWAIQAHDRQVEERKRRELKPADLLVVAELVDRTDKQPAKLQDWYSGKPTEVSHEIKLSAALEKKSVIYVTRGHRGDARTYAHLSWGLDKKDVAHQLPGFGTAKRAEALDALRRKVVGDAEADACQAEGRYATAWLNGPFDLDPKLRAQKEKDDANRAQREAEATEARAAMEAQLATVKRDVLGGPETAADDVAAYNSVPAAIGVPLPWSIEPWGNIIAANGKTVDEVTPAYWRDRGCSPEVMAMQLLIVTAVHRAAGLPDPAAPEPGQAPAAATGDDEDDERACRVFGCTDEEACELDDGPCSWVEDDLCSNPECIAAAAADSETETPPDGTDTPQPAEEPEGAAAAIACAAAAPVLASPDGGGTPQPDVDRVRYSPAIDLNDDFSKQLRRAVKADAEQP